MKITHYGWLLSVWMLGVTGAAEAATTNAPGVSITASQVAWSADRQTAYIIRARHAAITRLFNAVVRDAPVPRREWVMVSTVRWSLLPADNRVTIIPTNQFSAMVSVAAQPVPNTYRLGVTVTWMETPQPGAVSPPGGPATVSASATILVRILDMDLVPDYNHDRTIAETDRGRATPARPFRFWINDDADKGDFDPGGHDVPGQVPALLGGANYNKDRVCGRCDLADFFPVWLDLNDVLQILGPGDTVQYKLRHQPRRQIAVGLKAVYTDLTRDHAGDYLIVTGRTYGASFNEPSYQAKKFEIKASGVTLSGAFLNNIRTNAGKGVLMVEGGSETTSPLILEVWNGGAKIAEKPLPLSISGVTNMFRYLNLRPVCGDPSGGASRMGEPGNNPDDPGNRRTVVYLHGFNETANDGLANMAEVFKRLYWSGSRARYIGVTWRGNQGGFPVGALRYHPNVTNAFVTASRLAVELSHLPGEVNVMAYSLGNMVVSSAIQDHGLRPARYFLVHAAMAKEAYDGNEYDAPMIQEEWVPYTNRVYASEWHGLFAAGDGRNGLTWRNRFRNAVTAQTYNFYSSEDDVLDNVEQQMSFGGTFLSHLLHWNLNFRRYAWALQELYKGRQAEWQAGTPYGGWEFKDFIVNTNYYVFNDDPTDLTGTLYTPAQAALISPADLRAMPFFDISGPIPSLLVEPGNPAGPGSDFARGNRNLLIAETIPALSFATGRNALSLLPGRNFNMNDMKPNGWPRYVRRPPPNHGHYPWIHGDHRAVAYYYVYQIFDRICERGGFNQ